MPTINHDEQDPESLGKEFVEKMTNWQRTQWAKAGYPGLQNSHYEADKIRPYFLKGRSAR